MILLTSTATRWVVCALAITVALLVLGGCTVPEYAAVPATSGADYQVLQAAERGH